jgi:fatty acyl-CoA reductase
MFNFDIKSVIWGEYIIHYLQGVKMYAIGENFENMEQTRRAQRR